MEQCGTEFKKKKEASRTRILRTNRIDQRKEKMVRKGINSQRITDSSRHGFLSHSHHSSHGKKASVTFLDILPDSYYAHSCLLTQKNKEKRRKVPFSV